MPNKTTKQSYDKSNKLCYAPSPVLKKRLHEMLQEGEDESKREGAAGSRSKRKTSSNSERRNRNYALNKILFPSMANVVFFLEMMAKHKDLRGALDNELEELLGLVTPPELKNKGYRSIIFRLLNALVTWDEDSFPDDFRLEVIETMLRVAESRLRDMVAKQMGTDIGNLVSDDSWRTMAWAAMFARKHNQRFEIPDRPVLFGASTKSDLVQGIPKPYETCHFCNAGGDFLSFAQLGDESAVHVCDNCIKENRRQIKRIFT